MTSNFGFENSPVESTLATSPAPAAESSATLKLQHDLEALESIGFKTYPWKVSDSNESVLLPTLDVNWLIAQPSLPYLVQIIPTQLLHRSLNEQGLEDSLEVIDAIRGDALVRLMDYELWVGKEGSDAFLSPEEDLSGERFLQWIRLWNEISPEFACERFVELDEGVIVGCLTSLVEIVPIGLTRQQEELTDDYWITPDNKFGLRIKTTGESDFEVLHAFVHSLYARDIRLAQQILSHAAMVVRDEAVDEARRWRCGRLEDQGYLTADEARMLLLPKTQKQLNDLVQTALKTNLSHAASEKSGASSSDAVYPVQVDDEAYEKIRDSLRSLDPETLRREIELTLGEDDVIRLAGSAAAQTESLLQEEEVIDAFVERVVTNTQQLLIRLETHNRKIQKRREKNSNELLIDRILGLLSESDPSSAVSWKTRLARTANGVSAALGVSNEASELGRVLEAVRGCLNIGLEGLMKEPERFAMQKDLLLEEGAQDDTSGDLFTVALVKILGPEVLFQVGWQSLQSLAQEALDSVLQTIRKQEKSTESIGESYKVRLSDGEVVELPVDKLLKAGRYLEVRKWLQNATVDFGPAVEHVLLATVNRLPVFPIILGESKVTTRGRTDVKPYQSLQEIEHTRDFIQSLDSVQRAAGQEE